MTGVCRMCGWLVFLAPGRITLSRCRCGGKVADLRTLRRVLGVDTTLHVLNVPPEARVRALATR